MHLHLPYLIFADIYNSTRSRLAQGGRTWHSTKEMQILWRGICPWFQFDTSCTTQTWKIIRPIGQEELLICSVPYMQTNVLQDKYKQTYPNQTPGKNQPSIFWKTWYLNNSDQDHYNIVDLIIFFHITGSKTVWVWGL